MKEIFQLRATSQAEEENTTNDDRLHDLLKNGNIKCNNHEMIDQVYLYNINLLPFIYLSRYS